MGIASKLGRVQVRATRRDGWTKPRRKAFLAMLAVTCNVRASAKSVGMSDRTVRDLRRRDGAFALLWDEALAAGYERLENDLIAYALGQTSRVDTSRGENPSIDDILTEPTELLPFDPQLAIQVLKFHRAKSISAQPKGRRQEPKTQDEVDTALIERLDRLAARREREQRQDAAGGDKNCGSDGA